MLVDNLCKALQYNNVSFLQSTAIPYMCQAAKFTQAPSCQVLLRVASAVCLLQIGCLLLQVFHTDFS